MWIHKNRAQNPVTEIQRDVSVTLTLKTPVCEQPLSAELSSKPWGPHLRYGVQGPREQRRHGVHTEVRLQVARDRLWAQTPKTGILGGVFNSWTSFFLPVKWGSLQSSERIKYLRYHLFSLTKFHIYLGLFCCSCLLVNLLTCSLLTYSCSVSLVNLLDSRFLEYYILTVLFAISKAKSSLIIFLWKYFSF